MPELPPLLVDHTGQPLTSPAQWTLRRQELLSSILEVEYGALPPPVPLNAVLLNTRQAKAYGGATHCQYRLELHTSPPLSFTLDVRLPAGASASLPVLLNGDACWDYLKPEVIQYVLARGFILATFNRTEIVPDAPDPQRQVGLNAAFPGLDFGALAAWAWGYHRAVDFLLTLPAVDPTRIAISGHSRGGKTALLAGATDERIALTNPNDSGCGGAGCYRIQGAGSETLADILRQFPFWFSPRLPAYIGREHALPFDQHALKALVAPRRLLSTEALGDLWANPSGTWHTHAAAAEVFRFLGVEERIAIWYRPGGHEHSLADFAALLDFAAWQFDGAAPAHTFNQNPFE
jgi:hypothetical protein